jgi:hypothetical protein
MSIIYLIQAKLYLICFFSKEQRCAFSVALLGSKQCDGLMSKHFYLETINTK